MKVQDGSEQERFNEDRFDNVSIALHWTIGIAIITIAVVQLLGHEILPKGSGLRGTLKALHDPAGTIVLCLVLLRLIWRSFHPAPASPGAMRPWEFAVAKSTHLILWAMMVLIPVSGIAYTLARGMPIDFGLFQIMAPADLTLGRNAARAIKKVHEFLGQAILWVALAHAAAALWHHYIRKDHVLMRMLPRRYWTARVK
jgi:cytochrome b561